MGSEVCGEGAGVRRGGSGYTSLSQLSGMAAVHDGVFHGHVALGSKSVPRPSSSATEDTGERPRLRTTSGARDALWNFSPHPPMVGSDNSLWHGRPLVGPQRRCTCGLPGFLWSTPAYILKGDSHRYLFSSSGVQSCAKCSREQDEHSWALLEDSGWWSKQITPHYKTPTTLPDDFLDYPFPVVLSGLHYTCQGPLWTD